MPSLISDLNRTEQREVLNDLNYLNLTELRSFCKKHAIPYTIWIETDSGDRKKTKDSDRKSVVLDRVRQYLKTGRVPQATCIPSSVVGSSRPPTKLKSTDRLYYGWYDKKNKSAIDLLRRLTKGKFRNGAIARMLAREFWTSGVAPTLGEFAEAWTKADSKGLGRHPEWAWLSDRADGRAAGNWKARRLKKARKVLKALSRIRPP